MNLTQHWQNIAWDNRFWVSVLRSILVQSLNTVFINPVIYSHRMSEMIRGSPRVTLNALERSTKQIINWAILFPFYFSNITLRTNLLAYRVAGAWVFSRNSQLNAPVASLFWQPWSSLVRILACESLYGATRTGFQANENGLAKAY